MDPKICKATMVKNLIKVVFTSFFLVLLISNCKKDPNSKFKIGIENRFVKVTAIDPKVNIISPWHDAVSYEFDIDDDGTNDMKLSSRHTISPGGLDYQRSALNLINNSYQISYINMIDTLHKCVHIDNDSTISYTLYNNYSDYHCDGESVDSVYSPEIFSYPKVYSNGDTFTGSEAWSSNELTFSYINNSSNWWPIYSLVDIVRGNWNNQNLKYVLFRKENGGEIWYGWLKLSINNYKEISLYEFAIQK